MVNPKVLLYSTSARDFYIDPVQPMILGRGGLALDLAVRTYASFKIVIPSIPITKLKFRLRTARHNPSNPLAASQSCVSITYTYS